MKRLYLRPEARGLGLGRALVAAAVEAGERLGYREMRLDSLPFMEAAIALYRAEGFVPVAPYYDTRRRYRLPRPPPASPRVLRSVNA
jgi:GNAT superfamily N-acetyltransferase